MRSFLVLCALLFLPMFLVAQNQLGQQTDIQSLDMELHDQLMENVYSSAQIQADTQWAQLICVENIAASTQVRNDSVWLYFKAEIPKSSYQPDTTTGCIQQLDIVNNGSTYLLDIYWSAPPSAGPSHFATTTCYDTVLIENIPFGSYGLILNSFGGREGLITDSMGVPIAYTTDTILCEVDTLNFQILSSTYYDLNRSIQLYPNPADEYLSFSDLGGSDILSLQIIDAHGRIVRQIENLQAGGKISVNGLPVGVYMVRVRSTESGQTFFLKFMKQ